VHEKIQDEALKSITKSFNFILKNKRYSVSVFPVKYFTVVLRVRPVLSLGVWQGKRHGYSENIITNILQFSLKVFIQAYPVNNDIPG
jgi:hypothetical protein